MTTEEIINDMRSHTITSMRAAADRLEELQRQNDLTQHNHHLWKREQEAHAECRRDLALLITERDDARAEVERQKKLYDDLCAVAEMRMKEREDARAEVAQLKDTVAAYEQATVKQSLTVRTAPSRLEIAAMLMAANLSRETDQWETIDEAIWAVEQADALIAAAREVRG
jgi:hypothetical protein